MTQEEIKKWIDRWSKLKPSPRRDMTIEIWSKALGTCTMGKETLEEAAERFYPINSNGSTMEMLGRHQLNNSYKQEGFIAGAKWQAERMYSEEEVFNFAQNIITEIETRKQNIISNSKNMTIHLLEGGCMAFESSQDVVKELFKQFKK